MRPAKRVDTFFRCPQCGGESWGSSGDARRRSEFRGHCHGPGCRFTWMRSDDWRVFMVVLKPTRAEYQKYEALRLRNANRELKKDPPRLMFVGGAHAQSAAGGEGTEK